MTLLFMSSKLCWQIYGFSYQLVNMSVWFVWFKLNFQDFTLNVTGICSDSREMCSHAHCASQRCECLNSGWYSVNIWSKILQSHLLQQHVETVDMQSDDMLLLI